MSYIVLSKVQLDAFRDLLKAKLKNSTIPLATRAGKSPYSAEVARYFPVAQEILGKLKVDGLDNWLKQIYYEHYDSIDDQKFQNTHLKQCLEFLGLKDVTELTQPVSDNDSQLSAISGIYKGCYIRNSEEEIMDIFLLLSPNGCAEIKTHATVIKNLTGRFTFVSNNLIQGFFEIKNYVPRFVMTLSLIPAVQNSPSRLEGSYGGHSEANRPMGGRIFFVKEGEYSANALLSKKPSSQSFNAEYFNDIEIIDFFAGYTKSSQKIGIESVSLFENAGFIPRIRSSSNAKLEGYYTNYRLRSSNKEIFANQIQIYKDGRVKFFTVDEDYDYYGRTIFYVYESMLLIWLDHKQYKGTKRIEKCSISFSYQVKEEHLENCPLLGFGIWNDSRRNLCSGEVILLKNRTSIDSKVIQLDSITHLEDDVEKRICSHLKNTAISKVKEDLL